MLNSLAAAAAPFAHGPGFGLWWIHPLVTLLWVAAFVVLIVVVVRRGRRMGPPRWLAHTGPQAASASAEATLAERFAQGDIDEKEYRERLDVLRATRGTDAD